LKSILIAVATTMFSVLAFAANTPVIYWTSDPAKPDSTVVMAGGNFTTDSVVELALQVKSTDAQLTWTQAKVLQSSEQSLMFVIPADWKQGIYHCRVKNGAEVSKVHRINAPDVWWMQGDAGVAATAGGWLRVFGRNLRMGAKADVFLVPEKGGDANLIEGIGSDPYSLQAKLPGLIPGVYDVSVSNGFGSAIAGKVRIDAAVKFPETIFDVMDFYGKDKEKELQRTIKRSSKPVDRTEAILAALKKAEEAGGGVVYFPAGTYGILKELKIPKNTTLKGEGTGLAVLRWGAGAFALDGGGSQKRDEGPQEDFTGRLMFGDTFRIEDLSLYVPLGCNNAIQAGDNFAMNRVMVRVDRYWMKSPQRQDGTFLRVGKNFTIADCDILAKGSAIAMNGYGVVQRNKIQAGKCNCELGHSSNVIVEDNQMISLDPTAYINVYEEGRNVYYARNKHESLYAHQSDFSFTFDGHGAGYLGGVSATDGVKVMLAADPVYLKWANETSKLWNRSALCILSGRGAGQYRFVTSNKGREWTIDAPFEIQPDATSIVSIVPYRGRALVIQNRFEDANWVNMGYGSSLDVVCAENTLVRCGQMLNYGLKLESGQQPSWRVQYIDNQIHQGHTLIESSSPYKAGQAYEGPITRWCVHRGTQVFKDNSGNIKVGGNAADTLVEDCVFEHPAGFIENSKNATGSVFRRNKFKNEPAYRGEKALVE